MTRPPEHRPGCAWYPGDASGGVGACSRSPHSSLWTQQGMMTRSSSIRTGCHQGHEQESAQLAGPRARMLALLALLAGTPSIAQTSDARPGYLTRESCGPTRTCRCRLRCCPTGRVRPSTGRDWRRSRSNPSGSRSRTGVIAPTGCCPPDSTRTSSRPRRPPRRSHSTTRAQTWLRWTAGFGNLRSRIPSCPVRPYLASC